MIYCIMAQTKVHGTFLQTLEDALINRDVRLGFSLLDETLGGAVRFDHRRRDAISLLLCITQWIDLGYRDLAFLDSLYHR